jgi:isopenicillin N synthase-like dioxygenase
VESFRDSVGRLYAALDDLGTRVLQAVARHLGLPRDWFDDKVRLGNSVLRLLHYPPAPFDGANIRRRRTRTSTSSPCCSGRGGGAGDPDRDGRWLPVNPPAGAVVCNIGDMLERLTGGRLPSTTHRVVNPAPERRGVSRYSTPFFLHFEPEFLIESLPGGPRREPPITAHAFLEERLREIKLR